MIIGLTGPTGAGKSSAAQALQKHGYALVDADKIAHELYDSCPACVHKLSEAFPGAVQNGRVDRRALASAVFADSAQLERLNQLVLPYILKEIQRQLAQTNNAVLDAPTLFESGADSLCDQTIAVVAPKDLRQQRIQQRDHLTPQQALERIHAQPDDTFYRSRADFVLDGSGSPEQLRKQIENFLFEKNFHAK